MTYYVYIMASFKRVLYTGVTNHIERRVGEHKQGRIHGFTERYKTHSLVHVEPYGEIRAAIAREKQIKGWLRARKVALIESTNPQWKDLSADWGKGAIPKGVILSGAKDLAFPTSDREPLKSEPRESKSKILRPETRDSE